MAFSNVLTKESAPRITVTVQQMEAILSDFGWEMVKGTQTVSIYVKSSIWKRVFVLANELHNIRHARRISCVCENKFRS